MEQGLFRPKGLAKSGILCLESCEDYRDSEAREQAPNDIGFTFNCHQRLGLKAVIPPVNKNSQLSVRSDYDSTFRVRAAQLFNILPPELRATTSLDGFKAGLGRFMEQCPDTPLIPGYTPSNDNSLLSWRRTHTMQLSCA
ncbi:hypothetical protein ACHWQZ_G010398 [Mnemiopsis leidyi]